MPKSLTPAQERRGNVFIKVMSRVTAGLYRRTGGKIGGKFIGGAPVCLLTTTGRTSGELRTMPLLYLRDGDEVIIVASKGGFPSHPQWYLNLLKNPEVTIQIGSERLELCATEADDDLKAELWPKLVAMYADFDAYQARTDREIPVIVCRPRQ